jgi:hypothetical protein
VLAPRVLISAWHRAAHSRHKHGSEKIVSQICQNRQNRMKLGRGGGKGLEKEVYRSNQSREIVVVKIVGREREMLRNKSPAAGPEEWMEWCAENKVLVGQMVELTHYEIEACRRHFMTLKFKPSDEGAAQQTLADSFHRAEVFASLKEALLFCNKLAKSPDSLVTFADLLNAANGSVLFKKNKVTSYMKFVASSEVFQSVATAHAFEMSSATVANAHEAEGSGNDGGASRSSLSSLFNGAAEMLAGVFTVRPTTGGHVALKLVTRQKKTSYQRQESGETFRNYSLRKGSKLPPPSPPSARAVAEKPWSVCLKREAEGSSQITDEEIQQDQEQEQEPQIYTSHPLTADDGSRVRGHRPSLQKLDSCELRIRPAVRLKTAVIKVFATNRLQQGLKNGSARVAVVV